MGDDLELQTAFANARADLQYWANTQNSHSNIDAQYSSSVQMTQSLTALFIVLEKHLTPESSLP
jgi:hypothetical protein